MKTRMTGATVKKHLITFLLILGAVVGSSAPFMHKFFPKVAAEKVQLEKDFEEGTIAVEDYRKQKVFLKEKYQFVGFTNKRRFVLALGHPVSLFFCAFFGLIFSKYIYDQKIKRIAVIASTCFLLSASYFIIWNLWWYTNESDFPRWMYYTAIAVMAIATTIFCKMLINGWFNQIAALHGLKTTVVDFLVEVKTVHFKKLLTYSIRSKIDVPQNDNDDTLEELEKTAKDFDNRVYETFEKVK